MNESEFKTRMDKVDRTIIIFTVLMLIEILLHFLI